MLLAVARHSVYTRKITLQFGFYCMLMYKKAGKWTLCPPLSATHSKNACAAPGVIFLYTKHCTSILNV